MQPFVPDKHQPPESEAQIDAFRGEDLGREPDAPPLQPYAAVKPSGDPAPYWYRLRIQIPAEKGGTMEREGDFFTTSKEMAALHDSKDKKIIGWYKHWPQPIFKPIHTNLYF